MLRSLVPRSRSLATAFLTKNNSNLQWKSMMIERNQQFSTTLSRYQLEKPTILNEQRQQRYNQDGKETKKVSIFGWFMLVS